MDISYDGDVLAYIGDVVIELLVRERFVKNGERDTGKLSSMTQKIVCAPAQSETV